jgi:hypothetical protein
MSASRLDIMITSPSAPPTGRTWTRFYHDVLIPLVKQGLCTMEDPPCDCPEHGEGYYATFFFDPDGLKYEFVHNPNHGIKKARSDEKTGTGISSI